MWSELFLMNKYELLKQMDAFEDEFRRLRRYILEENREEMQKMMRTSTERRKKFDKK
jgi:prephenate dehydrogenase